MRYTLQILEIEMNNSDYGITLSQRHAPSVMFRRGKKKKQMYCMMLNEKYLLTKTM